MRYVVVVVMAAMAATVWQSVERRRRSRRWERTLRPDGVAPGGARGRRRQRSVPLPTIAAMGSAALVLALVPWPLALPLAGGAAAVAPTLVALLNTGAERDRERRMAATLPLLLDLLAAAWASGATAQHAIAGVGRALGGDWGHDLERVAARAAWGATWAEAFDDSMLRRLAAPAVDAIDQAHTWGTAPATALAQAAATARDARRRQGEAAARAVAVSVVGPLGLCFLPAFVLLGIAPAVLGAVGAAVG